MTDTWANQILNFNRGLNFKAKLPEGFEVMNPFKGENARVIDRISSQFYQKFYDDLGPRNLILGINPGRLGAGLTGLPFTDTKRLNADCGIPFNEFSTHEPSSVFVYEVINAFGGPEKFYNQFYINSVCPLGFLVKNKKGNLVNANYYDDACLYKAVKPFIIQSLKQQVAFGVNTDKVWCLGAGKNYKFLKELNNEIDLFGEIIPLEHPRYVVQYKSKLMPQYLEKFIAALG
jgi:hypothetical protein